MIKDYDSLKKIIDISTVITNKDSPKDNWYNTQLLQWRNRLAHGTYRQYRELCRGCEFEPHLEHVLFESAQYGHVEQFFE